MEGVTSNKNLMIKKIDKNLDNSLKLAYTNLQEMEMIINNPKKKEDDE